MLKGAGLEIPDPSYRRVPAYALGFSSFGCLGTVAVLRIDPVVLNTLEYVAKMLPIFDR